MFKALIAAGVLAITMTGPVLAQDAMACDEASMTKMESDTAAMPAEKKEMVMKEMALAKTAMMENKMDDCKMHMDNAMKAAM